MTIHLNPGDLLNSGRYRIIKELNRGGTAVVYSANDGQTQSTVALKVMLGPEHVPVKIIKREIAFSSGMRHPNIVRLLDMFAEKQQLVIVWELIDGPDLLDLLNEHKGRLPEPVACFYFVQLLEAVTFMHNSGFCHRDIKPENMMVQRNTHRLKLIDFGLSKHLNSAHTRGVGTPDYMCPEMLPHQGISSAPWNGLLTTAPSYDARAVDAWAMGVLMFLLITGKYPFEDPQQPQSLARTISNIMIGRRRPFPEEMSEGCKQLITGLLKPEPTTRTTLVELKSNEWLHSQAFQYASSKGLLPLLDFRRKGKAGSQDGWTIMLMSYPSSRC